MVHSDCSDKESRLFWRILKSVKGKCISEYSHLQYLTCKFECTTYVAKLSLEICEYYRN